MVELFLDNNATTQPLAEVINAVVRSMRDEFGNASSANRNGARGRRLIDSARVDVADLLNAKPESIFFTSGATESNNWVVHNHLRNAEKTLITTTAEHSSLKENAERAERHGRNVWQTPVDSSGRVKLDELARALSSACDALVAIHWVNNETGTIQPIEDVANLCRRFGAKLLIDAAQAVGKLPIEAVQVGADFLSCSAHKIHGPQGVGALFVRDRIDLDGLHLGGTQERGLRGGTENLPGIVGFGVAARKRLASLNESRSRMLTLRDSFERQIFASIDGVHVNGDVDRRACNTSNLRFADVDGEALVARLDQEGVICSQSSACTNQLPEPSYVLRAMGLSEVEAYSSVRFAVSVLNTEEEIETAVTIIADLVAKLRRFHRVYHTD